MTLGRFIPDRERWIWFAGCHGGAGESTLVDLVPASGGTDRRWPLRQPVVLTARTNARGLLAARSALAEWSSGVIPTELLGIVLSADAPGRLPKGLGEFVGVIAGGAPRAWYLPWIPEWRTGDRADTRHTARLIADIARLTAPEETP